MKYSFHPLARKEFIEAIDYYNECQDDLGFHFADEIFKGVKLILKLPEAWSPLSKNTRRCLINRFPYGLIYQKLESEILIIAVMQLSRKPDYWQNRI